MVITTSPLVKTYTLEEFWELPAPQDRSKLELIKGVLYMTPPPDYRHNEAFAHLNRLLHREVERHGYNGLIYSARAALWIDEATYLEPDLLYISEELKAAMPKEHWSRADIVVEIISPSNSTYDRTTKSDTYQAMGIRELWLVDTQARLIEVRCFATGSSATYGDRDVLRSEILSRIELPVREVFS